MNALVFPSRPGIGSETLRAAGISYSDTPEPACIEIPYHDLHGNPTGFSRWRLPHERPNGQKYYQRPDSGTRAYIPPQFRTFPIGGDLGAVEGEFKALSQTEAGYKTIGLPSFNTYTNDAHGGRQLLEGIRAAIEFTKPSRVLFIGDADTATNLNFARNAHFLAHALKPIPVVLPRLPIDGPKGIDDCRHQLGAEFSEFWSECVGTAEAIDLKSSYCFLAVRLLERESDAIRKSTGIQREKHTRRIVEMAAGCHSDPLAFDQIVRFAERVLEFKRTNFKDAVKKALHKRKQESGAWSGATSAVEEIEATSDLNITPNQWFKDRFPELAEIHGDPIHESQSENELPCVRDICEDFMSAVLGEHGEPDAPTVFLPSEGTFYTYEPSNGIFLPKKEEDLSVRISRLFLHCARECQKSCNVSRLEFKLRDTSALSGVLRRARANLKVEDNFFHPEAKFIALGNGMLRIEDRKLLPFSPSYHSRNKLGVAFDPEAKCPLFTETLLRQALDQEDIDLLQRWCGMALVGTNLAQRLMLLTGTAGGGKGAFVRVLRGIIGERNLASLRTGLLCERFEIGRFLGRTLLYGADVASDFLNLKSASVIKSLIGGDPMTVELKNSNSVAGIEGRFNIILTANTRLTVHLDGDADAWRRRLAIVLYSRPQVRDTIANLSERILAEEGSGVLRWMLDGLDRLRSDGWQLKLNARQQERVDDLLLESNSPEEFVRQRLRRDSQSVLTLNEAFEGYLRFCTHRGWESVSRNRFGGVIPDAVSRTHGVTLRRDISNNSGPAQQGWKGIRMLDSALNQKMASEPSDLHENQDATEASEGSLQLESTDKSPRPVVPLLSI